MAADSLAPAPIAQLAAHAFDSPSWAGATAGDAERHLGGPLRVVEGLPVESTSVGAVNGAPAVRVVQSLPGGGRIELVQWRSDSAEAQARNWGAARSGFAADRPTGTEETAIARGGVVVIVRGPVPADSLAALVRKIP